MTDPSDRDHYTSADVARLRGVTEVTVRRWRMRGVGPPWEYANGNGGKVVYPKDQYERWRASQASETAEN